MGMSVRSHDFPNKQIPIESGEAQRDKIRIMHFVGRSWASTQIGFKSSRFCANRAVGQDMEMWEQLQGTLHTRLAQLALAQTVVSPLTPGALSRIKLCVGVLSF